MGIDRPLRIRIRVRRPGPRGVRAVRLTVRASAGADGKGDDFRLMLVQRSDFGSAGRRRGQRDFAGRRRFLRLTGVHLRGEGGLFNESANERAFSRQEGGGMVAAANRHVR